MTETFEQRIVHEFAKDIASKLGEAALLARTASQYAEQGMQKRAFETLLEAEPLIHDTRNLINAASVMQRRSYARDLD